MSDWLVEVTVDELQGLRKELAAVIDRNPAGPKHRGLRSVHAIVHLFPPAGGAS